MFSSAMFSKPEYNSRGADDVIVFISMRFQLSTLKRYVHFFHFRERFQIAAVSMNTLSVLVWTAPKEMYIGSADYRHLKNSGGFSLVAS